MKRLNAHAFVTLGENLTMPSGMVMGIEWAELAFKTKIGNIGDPLVALTADHPMAQYLKSCCESCKDLGLIVSEIEANRLLDELTRGSMSLPQYAARTSALRQRIADEVSHHIVFQVPPAKRYLLTNPHPFGDEAATSFPSARLDMEEAAKCLALGRNMACVFHCMRVLEVALRVLAKSLNDANLDPVNNPNWGQILKRCNEELQKTRTKRTPDWQTNDHFYSEATSRLLAVKEAWRNPTLHVEATYTDDSASEVFDCVRLFARHLATVLSE